MDWCSVVMVVLWGMVMGEWCMLLWWCGEAVT